MKLSRITLAAVVGLSITGMTFAQPGQQREGGERGQREGGQREGGERGQRGTGGGNRGFGGGAAGFLRMMPVMAALDADEDGEISESEIKNAVAVLKKLDKNGDGKLSGDEIRPSFGRGPGQGRGPEQSGAGNESRRPGGGFDRSEFVNRIFEQNDKDKDGKLSASEIPERMARGVERIDTNKDGIIEKSELEAAFGGNSGRGRGEGGQGRPQRDGARPARDGESSEGARPRRPATEE